MLMKTSRILFILMVATFTLNSSANFTYERDSDKWFTAILIGQIGYYGGNCETASPPKHRKLQAKVLRDAFANDSGGRLSHFLEAAATFEFEYGGIITKTEGCAKTKERLDSLADSAGITGNETPQYGTPEEQDELIDFILNLPPKLRNKMTDSISREFDKMSK
jgi:hypothetical protein